MTTSYLQNALKQRDCFPEEVPDEELPDFREIYSKPSLLPNLDTQKMQIKLIDAISIHIDSPEKAVVMIPVHVLGSESADEYYQLETIRNHSRNLSPEKC